MAASSLKEIFTTHFVTIGDLWLGAGDFMLSSIRKDFFKAARSMQQTLNKDIVFNGIGIHSGLPVKMRLVPAPADHGIVFVRTDLTQGQNVIPALYDRVSDTRMCTVVSNEYGASVGTIEHLMAAIRGCGVDNLVVEIDRAEVPIMDGSSKDFVEAMDATGYSLQNTPRRAIKILKTITVRDGDKIVTLSPSNATIYKGRIEFAHPSIGQQDYTLTMVNGNFRHDVADCRTFGFEKDFNMLKSMGLAQGVTSKPYNVIGLDDNGVMNPEGLRCSDEFIRHKILDAVGDLALAGHPIVGTYTGYKGGHGMNNAILHALFADKTAWMIVDLHDDIADNSFISAPSSKIRQPEMAH